MSKRNRYVHEDTLPPLRSISMKSEANWRYCILCNRWWQLASDQSKVHYSGMKPLLPYTGEKCPECIRIQEKRKQEENMPKTGKLTEEQKKEVFELLRMGWTNVQIADKYGLHTSAITHYRKKWAAAKAKAAKAEAQKAEVATPAPEAADDDKELKAWEADIEENEQPTEPEAEKEQPEERKVMGFYEIQKIVVEKNNVKMENIRLQERITEMQREILVQKAEASRYKSAVKELKEELQSEIEKNRRLQMALNESQEALLQKDRAEDSQLIEERIASYIESKLNDLESQMSALYRVKNLIGA